LPAEPTEIYAPRDCLGDAPAITLRDGAGGTPPGVTYSWEPDRQRLFIDGHGYAGIVQLTVRAAASAAR